MFTSENLTILLLASVFAWVSSAVYGKLRPSGSSTREDQLELEIKRLNREVESLRRQLIEVVDVLSSRNKDLQDENTRLENELRRLGSLSSWRTTETAAIRAALERLSADEIRNLAFERFKPVFEGFGADQSLHAQRLALMEYAEKHGQLDMLRAAIAGINPAAFL